MIEAMADHLEAVLTTHLKRLALARDVAFIYKHPELGYAVFVGIQCNSGAFTDLAYICRLRIVDSKITLQDGSCFELTDPDCLDQLITSLKARCEAAATD